MVQEPLPVKASDVASPVTGAVLASRQREDRRPSPQSGDKKRPRPTPPPKTDAPPTTRTDDDGDQHEIDVLA